MSDRSRHRHADEFPQHSDLPLRQRLPEYLVIWVGGAAAGAALGAIINGVEGVGYAFLFLGIGFLLFGGAAGDGYASSGLAALGRMFRRSKVDDETGDTGPDDSDSQGRRKHAETNPQAFWSVVGGFAYLFAGFWLLG